MEFSAIIVAAGSGSRAGGAKQWRPLAGKPVVRWSVEAMLGAGARQVVIVVAEGAEDEARRALAGLDGWRLATGGATRAGSVRAGLAALDAGDNHAVLIHDAARPLVETRHIRAVLEGLEGADGAVPALPVSDTLKRAEAGIVTATEDRSQLWRVQTPQAFRLGALRSAYQAGDIETATDDASLVERNGGRVRIVDGDARLMKLTWPEDFQMATMMISDRVVRVGQGFDAHRWGPGDTAWLCGVAIPHDQALVGHSDADAGLHALTDAILGAMGDGDIGDHFPPSDPQWKGAASDRFLVHAVERMKARGGVLNNVDVTLICEQPKIKPHREAMRQRLSELLELPLDAISVKATTTEGMGFPGRGEGLAAQAIVAISVPAPTTSA